MERKQFYKKIDELTEHWYIDSNKPVKGTWATTRHPKGQGPRRKTNAKGEEHEVRDREEDRAPEQRRPPERHRIVVLADAIAVVIEDARLRGPPRRPCTARIGCFDGRFSGWFNGQIGRASCRERVYVLV